MFQTGCTAAPIFVIATFLIGFMLVVVISMSVKAKGLHAFWCGVRETVLLLDELMSVSPRSPLSLSMTFLYEGDRVISHFGADLCR